RGKTDCGHLPRGANPVHDPGSAARTQAHGLHRLQARSQGGRRHVCRRDPPRRPQPRQRTRLAGPAGVHAGIHRPARKMSKRGNGKPVVFRSLFFQCPGRFNLPAPPRLPTPILSPAPGILSSDDHFRFHFFKTRRQILLLRQVQPRFAVHIKMNPEQSGGPRTVHAGSGMVCVPETFDESIPMTAPEGVIMIEIFYVECDATHPDNFVFDIPEGHDCFMLVFTKTPAVFWAENELREYPAYSALLYRPRQKIYY